MTRVPRTETRLWVHRLGRHHFAHLRAVAEGIPLQESAARYLGVEHGHAARNAHTQTAQAVRAIARRRGETAWRLIGLTIRLQSTDAQPSLDDFMAARDLDGWSENDLAQMYAEAYPPNKKTARRARLLERQLALLHHLEGLAAETPQPTDLVSGWFEPLTAAKLIAAGLVTLADMQNRLVTGGRWYSALPGVGRSKAERIAQHLQTLLPQLAQRPGTRFTLRTSQGLLASRTFSPLPFLRGGQGGDHLSQAPCPPLPSPLLAVNNDEEAIDAWIQARAGSVFTATAYRREAMRLLLWLQYEGGGKHLSQMSVGDCGDFMAFLQNVPPDWISRVRAQPGAPGWAPFRGPLSHRSQAQSVVIVASLFGWLQAAQYLNANPWLLVNQKTGDDRAHQLLDTKALSEGSMHEILRFIEAQAPSPSRSRICFILRFVESVGLRSAELLQAQLGDLRLEPEGWVMQVHGKGAKNRVAAIPGQAFVALQQYLDLRGLGGIETAPPAAPLLASALDPMASIGYQALYETVRGWLSKAVNGSALPAQERRKLAGASTHWLRHTFGTRAIAREVPLDVIQAQMGHASIQTTTAIYGRAPIRRRVDELGKAFG